MAALEPVRGPAPHETHQFPLTTSLTLTLVGSTTISLLCAIIIIVTFYTWRRLRRHPAPLVACRAGFDALFTAALLASHVYRVRVDVMSDAECRTFASIIQYAWMAGMGYFAAMAVDLMICLSNPFTDYKLNTRLYHVIIQLLAVSASIILVTVHEGDRTLFGIDNYLSVCWIRSYDPNDNIDLAIGVFFLLPLAIVQTFSIVTMFIAKRRLAQGLPETLAAREQMYSLTSRFVWCDVCYWWIVILLDILSTRLAGSEMPPTIIVLFLAVMLGGKGLVTLLMWMLTFARDLTFSCQFGCYLAIRDVDGRLMVGGPNGGRLPAAMDAATDIRPHLNIALRREILHYTTLGIAKSVLRSMRDQSTDQDYGKYDVRFNTILLSRRKEKTGFDAPAAVYYAPHGPRQSFMTYGEASMSNLFAGGGGGANSPLLPLPTDISVSYLGTGGGGYGESRAPLLAEDLLAPGAHRRSQFLRAGSSLNVGASASAGGRGWSGDRSSASGLARLLCCGGDGSAALQPFEFVDYEPHLFRRMRARQGIADETYMSVLSRTRREKFSEGASGAFLYFSDDEKFIVKTLTNVEADVLLSMLHSYEAYLARHPHALITRFYGFHAMRMYGRTMHFVVMANVFTTAQHERYDLKGSWVGRHRSPLEKGQRTACRYCGQKFQVGVRKPGGPTMCPARPNRAHEPNTVMKDNDLTYKLRLTPNVAQALGDQIAADTEFLRQHGITDYSLLLGIHRTKFRLVTGAPATAIASLARATHDSSANMSMRSTGDGASASFAGSRAGGGAAYSEAATSAAPGALAIDIGARAASQARDGVRSGLASGAHAPSGSDAYIPNSQVTTVGMSIASPNFRSGVMESGADSSPTRGGIPLTSLEPSSRRGASDADAGTRTNSAAVGGERAQRYSLHGRTKRRDVHVPMGSFIQPRALSPGPTWGIDVSLNELDMTPAHDGVSPSGGGFGASPFFTGLPPTAPLAHALPTRSISSSALITSSSHSVSGVSAQARGSLGIASSRVTAAASGGGVRRSGVHSPAPPPVVEVSEDVARSRTTSTAASSTGVMSPRMLPAPALGSDATADTAAAGVPLLRPDAAVLADEEDETGAMFAEDFDESGATAAAASARARKPSAAAASPAGAVGAVGAAVATGVGRDSPALQARTNLSRSTTVHSHDPLAALTHQRSPSIPLSPTLEPVACAHGSSGGAVAGAGAPPWSVPAGTLLPSVTGDDVDDDTDMEGMMNGEQCVTPFYRQYRGGLRATIVEGPGVYYMGIIDILQRYSWIKRMERFFKTRVLWRAGKGVSAMAADDYALRFRARVVNQLIDGYQPASIEDKHNEAYWTQ